MKVLLVGSGGREHALAWKMAQSPRLEGLWCAPGNPGTARLGQNIALPEGPEQLVDLARRYAIDLAVIGPEAFLEAGYSDALRSAGIRVFGPSRSAAQIETSKAYAKAFMARHQIPTARFGVFRDLAPALKYLSQEDAPVVIKASGLAAGKGVILPESAEEAERTVRDMLVEGAFGEAGSEVVIEERLSGEEISLLAFTDGRTLALMPPAQDHKRLLDGDIGPNTGGMGAYAPAPACPPDLIERVRRTILQPAVDGLRAEGRPFVGVIYAGLILTERGPRALEFNCRFGDPETQAILPLLETDLLDIFEACVTGRLAGQPIRWKQAAAACVVLASGDYPGKSAAGLEITWSEAEPANTAVFHAGTRLEEDRLVTAGGRVLGITGWGATLEVALDRAYRRAADIHFEGMQYRRDIAHRALSRSSANPSAYGLAGVDIDAGNRAVRLMADAVRSTYTPAVLSGLGSFGGLFDASALQTLSSPVLVASTDGVGTKVKLAAQAGVYGSIGIDLVNHCINDVLVQAARPLFFLDYFASSLVNPDIVAQIVSGMAAACKEAGCVLLGGETAEMPGVYLPGEFDVAGTLVGLVERERILPRKDLQAGDVLIGLRSSGPHTNGYSLIRKVFADTPLEARFPGLDAPLGEALLAPHRSYLSLVTKVLTEMPQAIKALAHITGGGFIENIPRVLPASLDACIHLGSWPVPPLFQLIQEQGQIDPAEMFRVFNQGIGMVAIASPEQAPALQKCFGEETWVLGELAPGSGKVRLA